VVSHTLFECVGNALLMLFRALFQPLELIRLAELQAIFPFSFLSWVPLSTAVLYRLVHGGRLNAD